MGQLFTLLGYGVLNPPFLDEETHWDAVWYLQETLKLMTSYEAKPDYLVIPVAVSDPVLQDSWHLQPLPLGMFLPVIANRTAHVLQSLADETNALAHKNWTDLRATWQETQRVYAKAGLTLGEPSVILLNDWD